MLWNVVNADMDKCPCNCPTQFKVNEVCAYGGNNSCCTSGTVYKISCLSNGCKCFYIGKSQQYVKMSIQDHIGEVTKLYAKNILVTNCFQTTTNPPISIFTDTIQSTINLLHCNTRGNIKPGVHQRHTAIMHCDKRYHNQHPPTWHQHTTTKSNAT